MSEAVYDSLERESYITRAEVMHELSNPLNHSLYPVTMVEEHSGRALIQDALGDDLSRWTGDILDAFRIDKTSWSNRIIDPQTGERLN